MNKEKKHIFNVNSIIITVLSTFIIAYLMYINSKIDSKIDTINSKMDSNYKNLQRLLTDNIIDLKANQKTLIYRIDKLEANKLSN